MSRLVLKFGGTSVADLTRLRLAAAKVAAEVERGHQVVVVVSAMSGVTNQLLGYCTGLDQPEGERGDAALPPDTSTQDSGGSTTGAREEEYDQVVASGEQVTSGLMALALRARGLTARSYLGWQIPLYSTAAHGRARIERIESSRLEADLAAGVIPVVAGFQGVTAGGRITTLGRGGSDTSAVALAAALRADRCDIYTDVDGVYTTDPRLTHRAQRLTRVTFEEMFELASLGAKVLQTRSVEMALRYRVPVQVLSSFAPAIGSDRPGTLVTEEESRMESQTVTGIAYSRDEAQVTLAGLPDKPGIAAALFGPLAAAHINTDMIVQTASGDGRTTQLTFTVPEGDLPRVVSLLEGLKTPLGYDRLAIEKNVAKVSVVGVGMRSHPEVAATTFRVLSEKGINIRVISTSEIKISVLIDDSYTELAVRVLHTAHGLDALDAA